MSEKFFDPKQYSTLLVGGDGKSKGKAAEALIDLLSNAANREVREDVLKLLKAEKNALPLLAEAIANPELEEHRSTIIAACWEAGINCSAYLNLFTGVAINGDYASSIEAITVIENMEGPFDKKDLEESRKKLKASLAKASPEKEALLKDLYLILENFS